ncbi:MAG: hypothetical protein AAGF73_03135 [Actinomycetota bacterium]
MTVDLARSVLAQHAEEMALNIDSVAPMTCLDAGSERPYGDIVPAGLLLAGLRTLTLTDAVGAAIDALTTWLATRRTTLGFAFHTGTLPTATDSTLTMLGYHDAWLADGLARFADDEGGITPQLLGAGEGEMRATVANAHWQPADDVTTALAHHLRTVNGIAALTDPRWFAERAATRASVFVACPWIVDWAWSLAARSIDGDAGIDLRTMLAAELVASANPDGSFGRLEERPLATAAAVAAGDVLHDALDNRVVETARTLLAEIVLDGVEPQVPFASSQRCLIAGDPVAGVPARFGMVMLQTGEEGLATPGDEVHLLARYRDDGAAVFTGLALMALAPRSVSDRTAADGAAPIAAEPHPRYRCASLRDYFERFALPPALERATQ